MWWLRRGLCRPCTTHQHRDPVIRNFAQGLALASQATNLSFTVIMRDTKNHWYQCLPLGEPDPDRLLARSPNLHDSTRVTFDSATRAHTMPRLVERTCIVRFVMSNVERHASVWPETSTSPCPANMYLRSL